MEEVYKAFPYLIEGQEPWDMSTSEMPDGEHEVWGGLGAPGSIWCIIVL